MIISVNVFIVDLTYSDNLLVIRNLMGFLEQI